jgi:hypothetical protein
MKNDSNNFLQFFLNQALYNVTVPLKVLTNEKRGGLKMVAFDKSPFKLFKLKFSNKSVQSSSFERPKTAQRILFLLFANNNCFQIGGI